MNEHIARVAGNCFFDPAEYTWVYIQMLSLAHTADEEMRDRLLAHGGYATPLRTKDIKQPFEKLAIVVDTAGTAIKNGYLVFTCVCKNSTPDRVEMWGASGSYAGKDFSKRNPVSACFDYQASPEVHKKLLRAGMVYPTTDRDIPEEDFVVISFPDGSDVPEKFKDSVHDKIAPMLASLLAYIACVSSGALANNDVVFHRPSNIANNEKRRRKGKAPLYEWRTVSIEKAPPVLPSAPKGGTHASPRLHQRRGHWVTSKLGKRFWRSESVVGKAENGMIFHDYVNKGVQDAHVQA